MTILDAIGNTPLVELQGFDTPVPLYGKCEYLNPGGSVKDRLALAIVEAAEAEGRLGPGATIVEATAGNTGMGLALVAASRGYSLVCVLPAKMSVDKRQALAALGTEVMVVPNAPLDSPDNFRQTADRLARERGWFLADQFRNPANVEAHYRTTGPEIHRQLNGEVGAFVAGVGTGGTITGVGRYLKEQGSTRIALADPEGSSLAEWVRTGHYGPDGSYQVEGIGSSRAPDILEREVIDEAFSVSDEESFGTALRLQQKAGLLVGGSSGTAVVAAVRLARSGRVRGPVVALLADSWDRYFQQPWMRDKRPSAEL
ncbi:MAG: PLP-dependent cysteine synthase family protein [Vulcanimicrobiota bacterium]